MQAIQTPRTLQTRDQQSDLLMSHSESDPEDSRIMERIMEKRNSGSGQQGLQISVTANFYVLQQKLRRELMLRVNCVSIPVCTDSDLLRVDLGVSPPLGT